MMGSKFSASRPRRGSSVTACSWPAPESARRLRPALGGALGLLLLANACGYTHGYGSGKTSIRTISIETVDNQTYFQGLDQQLTRRLSRDLTIYTGLVPARRSQADAHLRVTLITQGGRSITDAPEGGVHEAATFLAVEVTLTDLRSGKEIHHAKLLDWAEFRAPVGETLQSALQESTEDISRRILNDITQVL